MTGQHVNKRKPMRISQEATHYRTWKSGKSWLYTAATVALIAGGGSALAQTVTAQTTTAQAATTTSTVAASTSTTSTETSTTTNSSVTSETSATTSEGAAYETATSLQNEVNSEQTVLAGDTQNLNTYFANLVTAVNDKTTLDNSGSTVYSEAIAKASEAITTALATYNADYTTYTNLVTGYNSALDGYQPATSQVPKIDIASYTAEVSRTLATTVLVGSTANLGSLSEAVNSATTNNFTNQGATVTVNQSENQAAYTVAQSTYAVTSTAYANEQTAFSEAKNLANALDSAVTAYNSVIALQGITQSQLTAAAAVVDSTQSLFDSQMAVASEIHTSYSEALVTYQSALDAYTSINEKDGTQTDMTAGDDATFETDWASFLALAQSTETTNNGILSANKESETDVLNLQAQAAKVSSAVVSVEDAAATYAAATSKLKTILTSTPTDVTGISTATSEVQSALTAYGSLVTVYDGTVAEYNSAISVYNSETGADVAPFEDAAFLASASAFEASAGSEVTQDVNNITGYQKAISAAAVVSSAAGQVNQDQALVSSDLQVLTTLTNQNTSGYTASQWNDYLAQVNSAEALVQADEAKYSSDEALYTTAASDYNSTLATYQVENASQVPDIPNFDSTFTSFQANFNSYTSALSTAASENIQNGSLAMVADGYYANAKAVYTSEVSAASALAVISSELSSAVGNYNTEISQAITVLNGTDISSDQLQAIQNAVASDAAIVSGLESQQIADEATFKGIYTNYQSALVAYQSALDAYTSINEASTGTSDLAGGDDAQVSQAYSEYLSEADAARSNADDAMATNATRVTDYIKAQASRDKVGQDIIVADSAQSALASANTAFNSVVSDSQLVESNITSAYAVVTSETAIYNAAVSAYNSDVAVYSAALQEYGSANGLTASELAELSPVDPGSLAAFTSSYNSYAAAMSNFSSEYDTVIQYMQTRDQQLANQPTFPSNNTGTDGNVFTGTPNNGRTNATINIVAQSSYNLNNLLNVDFQQNTVAQANTYQSQMFTSSDGSGQRLISSADKAAIVANTVGTTTDGMIGTSPNVNNSQNLFVTPEGSTAGFNWLSSETSIAASYTAPDGTVYQLAAVFTSYNQSTTQEAKTLNNLYFLNPSDPVGAFESLPLNWSLNNGQNFNVWFIYMPAPKIPMPPTPPAPAPLDLPKLQLANVTSVTPPTPKPPLPAQPAETVPLPSSITVPTVPAVQAPEVPLLTANYMPAPTPEYPGDMTALLNKLDPIDPTKVPAPIAPQTPAVPLTNFEKVVGLVLPIPPVALTPAVPVSYPTKDVTKTDNTASIDNGDVALDSNFVYELNSRTLYTGRDATTLWQLVDSYDKTNDEFDGTFRVYAETGFGPYTAGQEITNQSGNYFTATDTNGVLTFTATQAWLDLINQSLNQDVAWRIDADFYRYDPNADVVNTFVENVNGNQESSNTVHTKTPDIQPHKFDLDQSDYDITNNDLLGNDSEMANPVQDTANNPYADKTSNNDKANINTDVLNPGDTIVYQLWLDTTPFDNTSTLTTLEMTDKFDASALEADLGQIRIYSEATGKDVTDMFNILVVDGSLSISAKTTKSYVNAKGQTVQIVDTSLLPMGTYYKIDFPAVIKAGTPDGTKILNVAHENVIDANGNEIDMPTETRVNTVQSAPAPTPAPKYGKSLLPNTGDNTSNDFGFALVGDVTVAGALSMLVYRKGKEDKKKAEKK